MLVVVEKNLQKVPKQPKKSKEAAILGTKFNNFWSVTTMLNTIEEDRLNLYNGYYDEDEDDDYYDDDDDYYDDDDDEYYDEDDDEDYWDEEDDDDDDEDDYYWDEEDEDF